jgi:Na+/H+-dicarboxylate symporter
MISKLKNHKGLFSATLTTLLLGAVLLAIISHLFGFEMHPSTYNNLKSYFFTPLKLWIFPVIAASMFSIFFRAPDGKAGKFIILLIDIIALYLISTFIANIYAFSIFPLFPFAEVITPLLGDADTITFDKTSSGGIPTVILVMIYSVVASFVFRYFLHKIFVILSKNICAGLVVLLSNKYFDYIPFVRKLKADNDKAIKTKKGIDYSLAFINFVDRIIFTVLMGILLIAPFAVYSSFLEILNYRGFEFFSDIGKFIAFYAAILFSYQFFVMPIVRKIFCYGVDGETYVSFLKKSLPVMATAGTTSSSIATLATNIKVAQSLKVSKDMKDRGHNRALMPIGATFNMDGTSISLIVYFLLAANLSGMDVNFWWVVLTAVGLSIGTAAVPSASLIMLTSMYSAFSIPVALSGKLLSIIIAVDPIHDRIRTVVNTWGDLNMVYIVQSKRGISSIVGKLFGSKKKASTTKTKGTKAKGTKATKKSPAAKKVVATKKATKKAPAAKKAPKKFTKKAPVAKKATVTKKAASTKKASTPKATTTKKDTSAKKVTKPKKVTKTKKVTKPKKS